MRCAGTMTARPRRPAEKTDAARREPRRDSLCLERRDVDGLGTLVPGLSVVRHLGALGQRLEAAAVDAGVVDEEVLAALVRGDEAEALVAVEQFDGSGGHVSSPACACELRTRTRFEATTAGAEHCLPPDTVPG